jgi:hypothetical protein
MYNFLNPLKSLFFSNFYNEEFVTNCVCYKGSQNLGYLLGILSVSSISLGLTKLFPFAKRYSNTDDYDLNEIFEEEHHLDLDEICYSDSDDNSSGISSEEIVQEQQISVKL